MKSAYLEGLFPKLKNVPYEVTSPEDDEYNCVAWALGEVDRWWSPTPGYHWPDIPRDAALETFIALFEQAGYHRCDASDHEPGFDRVAVYAIGATATHVARQLSGEWWTSKCGGLEDIRHPLLGLEGVEYGTVAQVLRRRRSG